VPHVVHHAANLQAAPSHGPDTRIKKGAKATPQTTFMTFALFTSFVSKKTVDPGKAMAFPRLATRYDELGAQ
jgi:hypothetical protein